MSKIVALIGTTASGKSDLAIKVAHQTGAHILSCDSLLIYKDLNIGTAKPTDKEQEGIPHYGINLTAIRDAYSVGDYVRYSQKTIKECVEKNIPLIIVGGTGFYLKALLLGIWDVPPMDSTLRAELEKRTSEDLFEELSKKDPQYIDKIKIQDRYRLIRGLEIMIQTGKTLTEINEITRLKNALPYPVTVYNIEREQRDLERRIIERTNKMFEQGLINETKNLLSNLIGSVELVSDFEENPNIPRALHCVGYYEVMQFLAGKLTLPECRERIVISTRQLAKKQRTFFKGMGIPFESFKFPSQQEELERLLFSKLK